MGEILDRLDKERMGMMENKKNDVCRCIARVYRWGALRPHRCANPVWKDGYCKTHHREGRGGGPLEPHSAPAGHN